MINSTLIMDKIVESIENSHVNPTVVYNLIYVFNKYDNPLQHIEINESSTQTLQDVLIFFGKKYVNLNVNRIMPNILQVGDKIYKELVELSKLDIELDCFISYIFMYYYNKFGVEKNLQCFLDQFILFDELYSFLHLMDDLKKYKYNLTKIKYIFKDVLYPELVQYSLSDKEKNSVISMIVIHENSKISPHVKYPWLSEVKNIYNDDIIYTIMNCSDENTIPKYCDLYKLIYDLINDSQIKDYKSVNYSHLLKLHKTIINSILNMLIYKPNCIIHFKTTTFFSNIIQLYETLRVFDKSNIENVTVKEKRTKGTRGVVKKKL